MEQDPKMLALLQRLHGRFVNQVKCVDCTLDIETCISSSTHHCKLEYISRLPCDMDSSS